MKLDEYILKYDIESIFPKHYFDFLRLIKVPAGEIICHQDESLTALSYFVKGKIKIVRRLFNGKEYILDIQNHPTLIGNIELLTGSPTVSSVIALEESWIIQLPLKNHLNELLNDSTFLLKLGQGVAKALYSQNIKAATNLTYTVKERLATHILAIEEDGVFKPELSSLADSFGVSYRHLTRVLQELTQLGILEKQKPYYRITDRLQLEKWQITD